MLQINLKRDEISCIALTMIRSLRTCVQHHLCQIAIEEKELISLQNHSYITLSETGENRSVNHVSWFISASGAYSRLIVWFQFERSIGFFLIQTYIPAYLIVMLSWIAFWISHNSTPGLCNSSEKTSHTRVWYFNHLFESA